MKEVIIYILMPSIFVYSVVLMIRIAKLKEDLYQSGKKLKLKTEQWMELQENNSRIMKELKKESVISLTLSKEIIDLDSKNRDLKNRLKKAFDRNNNIQTKLKKGTLKFLNGKIKYLAGNAHKQEVAEAYKNTLYFINSFK